MEPFSEREQCIYNEDLTYCFYHKCGAEEDHCFLRGCPHCDIASNKNFIHTRESYYDNPDYD